MQRLLKRLLVAVMVMLLGLVVAWLGPERAPVRQGTLADFWEAASGVQSRALVGGPSWCLIEPADGWYLYTDDHMHGSYFYRVSEAEVLAHFHRAPGDLDGPAELVMPWSEAGFQAWEKADPTRTDVPLLLRHLRQAKVTWLSRNEPKGPLYAMEADFSLGVAHQRGAQFPLVQLGEWAYFSALIVFAAWPWIHNSRLWRWAVHVALIPPLLMLPYFLGYCGWHYTSLGPGGGVIYPHVLDALHWLPAVSLDRDLMQHVPRPLAPLTGPLGSILSMSYRRSPGPVAVVGLGLALGAAVLVPGLLVRLARPRPKPLNHSKTTAP